MGYNTPDVYYQPEHFGLEQLGEIEWGEADYSFDLTVVWRDTETGELFYAEDAGCSCPAPFEDYQTRESLTAVSGWAELNAVLLKRLGEEMDLRREWETNYPTRDNLAAAIGEIIQKIRNP